jgi:hypothetical protein
MQHPVERHLFTFKFLFTVSHKNLPLQILIFRCFLILKLFFASLVHCMFRPTWSSSDASTIVADNCTRHVRGTSQHMGALNEGMLWNGKVAVCFSTAILEALGDDHGGRNM